MTTLLALFLLAQPAPAGFPVPDCTLVPGWSQQGEARSFDTETLFDYMDGNSEGYFAYGFTLMRGVTCVNPAGDQLVLDVSAMGDPDRAWGFFVANRDLRSPIEAIGSAGQVLARKATFAKGTYYVEIAASPDKDHRPALRAFVEAMLKRVPGEAHVPAAVALFPTEGLEKDSVRLVPESVLGLRVLKAGFISQYPAGRALLVPETDAQAAQATFGRLRERFPAARAEGGLGDEAFSATDPYLGGLLLFRKGRNLAGVANVPAGQDPRPLAQALAARLP
ncbi:MAG TPA: DUF6599 family protein [Vicinamibacteria bacterium]|nr:DUF6599 family protein [Vicinamibacteria bacterium]